MKRRHYLFFLLSFVFFNYPSLPNATQPDQSDYGIINHIFLRFRLFGFYQEKKYLIKYFGRC